MELKQDYKNTDVGKIPTNWNIDLLENLTKVIDPHPSHRAPKSVAKGIPFLGIGDLNENGQIIKDKFRRVDEEIYEEHKQRYDLNKDLIGLGRVASIGKVIKLKNNIGKYTLSPTLGILDSIGINKGYLYYILNSEYIKSYFSKIMSGSTRSSVGMIVLRKIPIPLPPLPEQKAIAQVLSDTDNLIQAIEQKLTKKRAIKQGAMQQLLTPKEDWEVKKLGDLIHSFQNGYGFSASGYVENGIPIVTMAQIGLNGAFQFNENKVNCWQNKDFNILKNYHLKNGDVIIAMTDVTPDKNLIGRMSIVKSNKTLLLNQRVGLLRIDKNKINAIYLKTYSNMEKWRDYCIGSASLGVQANIGTKDILNGYIHLPNIEEQTQIATILSDMDAEIEQLEKKLSKYKMVKQGLMQNLLTGKIRLV